MNVVNVIDIESPRVDCVFLSIFNINHVERNIYLSFIECHVYEREITSEEGQEE